MKLTKIISLIVIAVIALSCNKDDDNNAYNFNKDNLTGTYSVSAFQSKEVKTKMVEGFNVVTTIISTGDTFDDLTVIFDSNDIRTMDGTYRIKEVKSQDNKPDIVHFDIIVLNNEKKSYAVNANTSELTIGNKKYKVSGFSRTGFKISFSNISEIENTVYTEEWVFVK